MKYACLHTHTEFCDGRGDVESFCCRALEKGLDSLGFSAHAPVFKKTGFRTDWNLKEEQLQEYLDAVNAAKLRWEGKLPIYLGLEVDYIPGLMGPADRDYRDMGLDYIIGSVHYLIPPHGAPFTVDGPPEEMERGLREGYGGDIFALIEAYWDSMEGLIHRGAFDILGHPDLIKKNNRGNRFFSENAELYCKRSTAMAVLAGKTRLVAELNTGGMNRGKIDDPYPSLALLKSFHENNVPVTINADAHKAEDLDGHYGEARAHLLLAGYGEAMLFGGKKENRAVWRQEKL